jgi:hypothetical protein
VSPTFTYTITQTPSPVPPTPTFTFTRTPTPTITAIPPSPTVSPVPTADKFEIVNPIVFPNPYAPKGGEDLHLRFDITQDASKLRLRIYTVALRFIREKIWDGSCPAGRVDKQVAMREFSQLANGIYYYIVIGESENGREVKSKPEMVVILR